MIYGICSNLSRNTVLGSDMGLRPSGALQCWNEYDRLAGKIGLSYRLRPPQHDFVHLELCKGFYLGDIWAIWGHRLGLQALDV